MRLISVGTSASVTAHSTYFSGESVLVNVMPGVTLLANALAVYRSHIAASDPIAAEIASLSQMNIHAATARASNTLFIRRSVKAVPFDDLLFLFKQLAAFDADQHDASPSSTSMY